MGPHGIQRSWMVAASSKRGKHSPACPSLCQPFIFCPASWGWGALPLWYTVGLDATVICSSPALLLGTFYVWDRQQRHRGCNSDHSQTVKVVETGGAFISMGLLAPFDSTDSTLHLKNIPAACSSHTPTDEQKCTQNGCWASYRNSDAKFLEFDSVCITAHCFRSQARSLPEEGRGENHWAQYKEFKKSTWMFLPITISLHSFLCLHQLNALLILRWYLTLSFFARLN